MNGGSLQKLQIQYESGRPGLFTDANSLSVLFNPSTLQFRHAADWNVTNISGQVASRERHVFEFKSTRPVELSFDLFFDIAREEEESALGGLVSDVLAALGERTRLRRFAGRLEQFARLAQTDQELHRPPCCKLLWGTRLLLSGVLTSLSQNFKAFAPDGTPTRAELSCAFTAVDTEAGMRRRELHSADVAKRRMVRQGDTLQSIAHEEYGDATRWRSIALQNRILNPLQLIPGTRLLIPPLE
ncbi:hypothetical protein ACLESD_01825 [Pyxidicoccus sp. 3LFB2]